MAKRPIPEINAGSMADIAFLLLIFFLVTTTMDVDGGMARRLPPPVEKDVPPPPPIKERNVLIVLINKDNAIALEGEPVDISQLRERVKDFILNPTNNEHLSETETLAMKKAEALTAAKTEDANKYEAMIRAFGPNTTISKGVVSLQNDRGTEYGKYIEVQNELVAAFNELKDELSKRAFGKVFDKLTESQQDLVKDVYPLSISEAEPRNIGGN